MDAFVRPEEPSLVAPEPEPAREEAAPPPPEPKPDGPRGEESNGVGDKIKIFEKAAEDAATAGRLSRPSSVRRPRAERLPSDELPPPPEPEPAAAPERPAGACGRRSRPDGEAADLERPRAEPQRIVRPEFRLASPAEVTIRSPSLGAKAPERFPSHGTAFRNVPATRDADECEAARACKARARERPTPARAGYFTRGSEEIWLVKKKDIEEIEERVLDSFRRAGGGGAAAARGRRGYARSESLEARGAGAERAALKRQASVACTCGHERKPRVRPAAAPRARSRSHGDPPDPAAVLDKYETLV